MPPPGQGEQPRIPGVPQQSIKVRSLIWRIRGDGRQRILTGGGHASFTESAPSDMHHSSRTGTAPENLREPGFRRRDISKEERLMLQRLLKKLGKGPKDES